MAILILLLASCKAKHTYLHIFMRYTYIHRSIKVKFVVLRVSIQKKNLGKQEKFAHEFRLLIVIIIRLCRPLNIHPALMLGRLSGTGQILNLTFSAEFRIFGLRYPLGLTSSQILDYLISGQLHTGKNIQISGPLLILSISIKKKNNNNKK